MTKKCQVHCALKPNRIQKETCDYIKNHEATVSTLKIEKELRETECDMLTWFSAGDCPKSMTEKVASIMKGLSTAGITQCGFTRNKKLWIKSQEMNNIKLCLTVENKERARKLCKDGLVSVPNYQEWTVSIYHRKERIAGCGGGFTCGGDYVITEADSREIFPEDCGLCNQFSRGCFVN